MAIVEGRYVGSDPDDILDAMFAVAQEQRNGRLNDDEVSVIKEFYWPFALVISELQSDMREVLDATRLDYAEGISLDLLCQLIGVDRNGAVQATGYQRFYYDESVDSDTIIPEGTIVQTDGIAPVRFQTTEQASIDGPSSVTDGTTYTTTSTSFVVKSSLTADVTNRNTLDVSTDFRTTNATYTAYTEIADATNGTVIDSGSTTSTAMTTVGPTTYDVSGLSGDITIEYRLRIGNSAATAEMVNSTLDKSAELEVAQVPIEAIEGGTDGNVGPDSVVTFGSYTPNPQLKTTNPASITGGRDREEDDELRERAQIELSEGARATAPAILRALRSLNKTESVTLFINDTDSDGLHGLPARTIEPVVDYNGEPQDVFDALINVKAAAEPVVTGVNGTAVTGVSELDNGQEFDTGYSEPNPVDIYIDADFSYVEEDYTGDNNVMDSIVDYLGGYKTNGELVKTGIGTGEDVIYGEIEYAIRQVPGVYDINTLTVGTSDNPTGTSNITVSPADLARTDARSSQPHMDVTSSPR